MVIPFNKLDGREFPELRAHIYFAAPGKTLKSALTSLASLQPICDITRVTLQGELDTKARAALVELAITPAPARCVLAFDALPLGPDHTRLVIRWLEGPLSIAQGHKIIRTIQVATNAVLIGG